MRILQRVALWNIILLRAGLGDADLSATIVSTTPLERWICRGSDPRSEKTPASLSGAIPLPTVYMEPRAPLRTRASRFGVAADSRAVLPSLGRSLAPSKTTIIIGTISLRPAYGLRLLSEGSRFPKILMLT